MIQDESEADSLSTMEESVSSSLEGSWKHNQLILFSSVS